MSEKELTVTNIGDAKQKVSDIQVFGDGDTFALLCKASSKEQGWMKSTKVCNVDDGCIVQVSTQQKNPDGSYAVAEALTYVPRVQIDINAEPRALKPILFGRGLDAQFSSTPQDEADRKRSEEEYKYKDYLGILLQLQQVGHECHEEINKTLKKVQEYMF